MVSPLLVHWKYLILTLNHLIILSKLGIDLVVLFNAATISTLYPSPLQQPVPHCCHKRHRYNHTIQRKLWVRLCDCQDRRGWHSLANVSVDVTAACKRTWLWIVSLVIYGYQVWVTFLSGVNDVAHNAQYGMSPWWPLLEILSWYPVMKSSLCNSFEDRAPVDFIYGCPIFKWVAKTWLCDKSTMISPQ